MVSTALIEKYRLAFDISPVPMLLASDDGKVVLANARFLDLFEYDSETLIGKSVEELVPPDIRAHHPQLRQAYHRTPVKREMGATRDLNGVTQSGRIIPLELGLEPVSEGEETFALVVAIDIRQRRSHEKRMHLAMDAAASAMVMVDENGVIVFVNRAASRLFGYDESDLLGQRVEMLVPEEFRIAHPVYTNGFMSDSKARSMALGRDLFARRRDGGRFPVEIALTPVDGPTGKLVMSTIVDLSERVAAAEKAERQNKELEALNEELSHFAYSASHDLKAPLSTITGLLNMCIEDLQEGALDEVQANLNRALRVSGRSADKIERILEIARAGRSSVESELIPLEQLIMDIWLDLTGGNSAARLVLDLDAAPSIFAEAATLNVIAENLLSNALRYADAEKPEHVIRVSSRVAADEALISVADNGVGIPPEFQAKVFMMFERLDSLSGDGLGLALVKKQIDRLGGKITLESTVGEGSTFSVSLPQRGKIDG